MKSAILKSAVAVAILGLSACGGGSSNNSGNDNNGNDGQGNEATTTLNVNVEVPSSLEMQVASSMPVEQTLFQRFAGLFINNAVAVDVSNQLQPEDFRVLILDDQGNVVEDLTDQAVITAFPSGGFGITVPGDPRVDCIILADLGNNIELMAPASQEDVLIDPVISYAYQQIVNQAQADPNFDWDNFSINEVNDFVDEVEALVEMAGGIESVNSFAEVFTMLDGSVGELVDDIVGDISDVDNMNNVDLASLTGEYTNITISGFFRSDFANDSIAVGTFGDINDATIAVASEGDALNFTITSGSLFDSEAFINSAGFGGVSNLEEDGDPTDMEMFTASVDSDLSLFIPIPEFTEIESDSALIERSANLQLMESNQVLFGTIPIREDVFGLANGDVDTANRLSTSEEVATVALVRKSTNFSSADLNGRTFGFVDHFFGVNESSNMANIEIGGEFGTAVFTDTTVTTDAFCSAIGISSNGAPFLFDINENDAPEVSNYTVGVDGIADIVTDPNELGPNEVEESVLAFSPDGNFFAGFNRTTNSTQDAMEGFNSMTVGVALPSNATQATLANRTYDLTGWFNEVFAAGNGEIGITQLPNLSLSFDGNGMVRLDGFILSNIFEIPPMADITEANFILESFIGQIDEDDNGMEIPIEGSFTVQPNGQFSASIPYLGGFFLINGYIQEGAETLVASIVVSSSETTIASPTTSDDLQLSSGVFVGYLEN